MDFPEFGNENNNENNYVQHENNDIIIDDEPQVKDNDDPFSGGDSYPTQNQVKQSSSNFMNMDYGETIDPEEQQRQNARKQEEDERRKKLSDKISQELEDKQTIRKSAMEYLQKWEELRNQNIEKKKAFNNTNEDEYLKQREEEKAGNINPWDKVIQNIQLKEGEHKGVRDISRMKAVILQRKNDFVNMKMK